MKKRGVILLCVLVFIALVSLIVVLSIKDNQTIQNQKEVNLAMVKYPVEINPPSLNIGLVEGMKIVSISVDGTPVSSLNSMTTNYNLVNEFIDVGNEKMTTGKGIEQNIYLTNNKATKDFALSNKIEISSDTITWNGTKFDLTKFSSVSPLRLGSWIDSETGNLIVPNIFFDDVYNKRIGYQDVAKNGGYAIAYQDGGKNYVELKIDGLSVSSSVTALIDPTYYNQTNGFSTSVFGSTNPSGITTNGSDFWIIDGTDLFVYHINKSGSNLTGGFVTPHPTVGASDITTNGSDFWITENFNSFVYHINSSGNNISGFLLNGSTNPSGITTNGSDFWITDYFSTNPLLIRYNSSFINVTKNSISNANAYAITTNVSAGTPTDFWIVYYSAPNVTQTNLTGSANGNSFSTSVFGSSNPRGIATNSTNGGTPTDFWIVDNIDVFVYHLSTQTDITPPFFTFIPTNTSINYSQGFGVDFNGSDSQTFGYYAINYTTLFTINQSGWLKNSSANVPVGNYYINVTINDTANNMNSTIYWVNISWADTTPPTITNPRNFTQMVNLSFSEDMSATDISGIGYYWLNDTSKFNISQAGIITNISFLNVVKTYWLNYSVNDTIGNQVSLIFNITLTPEPVPPPAYCNDGLRSMLSLIIFFSVLAIVFIPLYFGFKDSNVVILGAIAIIVSLALLNPITSAVASVGCG